MEAVSRHSKMMVAALAAVFLTLWVGAPAAQAPQIQSVSPPSVQLTAGGPAVSLRVVGRGVNQLAKVEVVGAAGRLVPDVSGQIRCATSTDCTISLRAGPSAPPGKAQLLALTTRERIPLPVALEVIVPPPAAQRLEIQAPQIRSVSPPSVQLTAGGRAVSLRLAGTGLNQLAQVGVVGAAGRLVPNVRGQIRCPTSTQCNIRLRAGPNARPGRGYRLFAANATGRRILVSVALEVIPPPALTAVSLAPVSITAGGTVQGTVTLDRPALANGAIIQLASTNAQLATVPPTVTVAAGQTTGTFTVATQNVGTATISAALDQVQRSASLTVQPAPFTPQTINIGQFAVTMEAPFTPQTINVGQFSVTMEAPTPQTINVGQFSVTMASP